MFASFPLLSFLNYNYAKLSLLKANLMNVKFAMLQSQLEMPDAATIQSFWEQSFWKN